MEGKNYLGIVDYCVVVGTLVFSVCIGIFYAIRGRNKSNNAELLVGSRNMGAIPVAASILVSYLSAITILGYPAEVYTYGTQVFLMSLLGIVTTPLAIIIFVKIMYDLKLTSAYQYLEMRYESLVMRWIGSLIFIIQLLFISGIVLYAPSIVMETMMGVPMWMSVIGVGICGTIYTSIGGIKAVVWTDVFQFVMIFLGMSAIVVKGVWSSGGFKAMFEIAAERNRLELFNWTIDPLMRHNTLNIILGAGFSGICFVVHQPVVQRYCGLPTFKDAVKSLLWSFVFGFFTISLVILTGISIFAHYANCDPLTSHQIAKSDQVVPFFVIKELAFIPGMMGLFAAVIFSAVLSTISSTLNSLAAVTWEDFLSKISVFKNMGDFAQTTTYKILSILYGIVCVSLAFTAQHFGGIFQAAITVAGTASGVQGSLFLMGVFMPFVNKKGAITGTIVGMSAMCFLAVQAILLQKTFSQPKLSFSIEECSEEVYSNFKSTSSNATILRGIDKVEWPEKLYTVSYILYSVIGGVITIIVSVIVSLCTGGVTEGKFVRPEYLHPIVRPREKASDFNCNTLEKNGINLAYYESKPDMMEIKM